MTAMRFIPERHFHARSVDPVPLLPGRWIAVAVAGSVLIDALLLLRTGLRIDINGMFFQFAALGMAAFAICYHFRTPATRVQRITRDLIEGLSLFALISLLGAVASYPLAAGHHALVDADLEAIDLRLHFHWISWYALIADHSSLQAIGRMAYLSIFVTPALLIGYFAWAGRRAEIQLFIATFWVAALITLALFPLLPAAGPFATLWHGSIPYMPLSGLYQDQVILALRQHTVQLVNLGALHGLVCAPSFHAASAVIYIATAYRIAALRWPITVLNIAMLLATPVEGTHYLTDILGGVAVACLALWLMPALIKFTAPRAIGWAADFERELPAAAG